MLKEQFDSEDFVLVVTKNFSKKYPSDQEKEIMWPYFKKECEKFFANAFDAKKARELNQIAQAFLSQKIKGEYAEVIKTIESFVNDNRLHSSQAKEFEVKAEGRHWVFFYKKHLILKKERKNIPTVLKSYLNLDVPVLVLALTEQEREGIFQGLWGLYIKELKNP